MKRESAKERAKRARTVTGVPTAVALFSGAGGLDLGFHMAGFRILLSTDSDPLAEKTHKGNWPDVPFLCKDVRALSIADVLKVTKSRRPDVLIGGPPCQGFSTLGSRLSSDPRNVLVDEFIRLAEGLRPQALVIENVRAIATEYKGRYRDYVMQRLTEIGYRAHFAVLDATAYGVPQRRKRAFFVAFADPRIDFEFPTPTHGEGYPEPIATVGAAIMDLVDKGEEVPNHIALQHSEKVVARYRYVPEGGMLPPPEKLPKEIRRENFGSTYKRLSRFMPALTIVPGNNALPIHPVLDRSLTPREAARIQSFPDSWVFEGDRRRQCILVGQAVPPLLARALAQSVRERILPLSQSMARLTATDQTTGVREATSTVRARSTKKPVVVADQLPSKLGFVDLFCGAGGFTIGFARAGLRPLVSSDINKSVQKTHDLNYPDVPFVHGDLGLPEVQAAVTAAAGSEVFAVVGGPPCQGFSVFGRRRVARARGLDPRRDPRNRLVFSFVDTVEKLMPRWVVMENVAGLVSLDDGSFVDRVVTELRRIGYNQIDHRVLDTADYGVPQRRKRFVLIANRTGHIIPWPKKKFFDAPKDWQKPHRTVGEAINDLADPLSHGKHTCHVPMQHKPLQIERFRHIPEGGKLDTASLPEEILVGYRTDRVKNFSHVFRRLHRNKPSITIVPGHNALPLHPWLDRALTVREAARIQTFPDEVEFRGARQDQCIQVGNAFPPLLAELIANNILKAESNDWYPESVPKLAKYSLLELEDGAAVRPGTGSSNSVATAAE